ncbi:hypothetical protein CYMTET_29390 [Cymbomonas tetramitiformis]|uniref:sn-1-specific diacylglycerol lipase n=1 Tax=Cymbomonas tetramitiformis TaxID=36881 RepID=A0AAE0FL34_9CHLO|nr:hypothetical protein CYMTET_29390 [Cymbomonas tetramitiformis]
MNGTQKGAGDVVVEYQRYFGPVFGWFPPGAVEWPAWTTGNGHPFPAASELIASSVTNNDVWEVETGPTKDPEGWEYATRFKLFDHSREGGRASKRGTDMVRRRIWRPGCGPNEASAAYPNFAKRESMAKRRAHEVLNELLRRVFIRERRLQDLLCIDMVSFISVHSAHQQHLADCSDAAISFARAHAPGSPGLPSVDPGDAAALDGVSELEAGAMPVRVPSAEEVEELVWVMAHARAAYGYAAQNGDMASVGKAVQAMTVNKMYFDVTAGVDHKSNTAAAAALAGLDEEDVLFAQWATATFRPCHSLSVDRQHGALVLTVRGSLTPEDVLTDVCGRTISFQGGYVHEGMLASAIYVHASVFPALTEAAARYPGLPLYLTGHSLGAGVAALLAALLREPKGAPPELGPIRCVVFGCPSVFDAVLSRRLGELGVVGVVLGHDVVPRMSVASMAACIQELARHGLVRRTGAAAAELFSALGQLVKRVSESVEESAGQMARRVEEGAENVVKKVEEGAEQVARSLNISAASSQTRMAWHAQLREEADEAALKEPQECRPRATFHSMSHQPPGCEHRGDTDPTAGKPGEPVMTSVSGEEASEMCIGAQTQEVRMYPPGRVMWLVRDEAPGRAGHVIVEMHPASFTRMTISNWSFTDHVPDNYMAALRFCAAPPLAAAENSAAQTSELALARDGCGSASGSSGEGSDGEDSSGMLSPGAMFGHWDLTVPFMPATRARTVTLQELSLVWEMQRYYGPVVGWRSPGLMEWPAWSNDEGEALPAEIHNSILSGDWVVIQGLSVDQEGWEYGMWFKQLGVHREGGRSSKRGTDMVRRRMWERARGPVKAPAYPPPEKQESMAKRRAHEVLNELLRRVFIRERRLQDLLCIDMVSFISVHSAHQQHLADCSDAAISFARAHAPGSPGLPSVDPGDAAALDGVSELEAGAMPVRVPSAEEVEELVWVMAHARAAYGYAAQNGDMASVGKAVQAMTVNKMYFDVTAGVDHKSNTAAAAALAGLDEEDVLFAQWATATFRPCHSLSVDRQHGALVLTVRGSLTPEDVLTDVCGRTISFQGGYVHEGMLASAIYVHASVFPALTEAAARYPGLPLYLTGHSLGAGVAALLAALLREPKGAPPELGPIRCVVFGCPSVFDAVLSRRLGELGVVGVVLGHDVVPRMSVASMAACIQELARHGLVRRTGAAASDFFETFGKLVKMVGESVEESAGQMARRVEEGAENVVKKVEEGAEQVARSLNISAASSQTRMAWLTQMWEEAGADEVHNEPGAILVSDLGLYEAASEDDKVAEGVEKRGNREVPAGNEESTISMPVSSGNGSEVRMYPPGRVMWLVDVTEDELSEGTGHVIVEMHRKSFTRMTISGRSITDHVPDKYMNALRHCATALPPAEGMGMEASPQKAL